MGSFKSEKLIDSFFDRLLGFFYIFKNVVAGPGLNHSGFTNMICDSDLRGGVKFIVGVMFVF